MKNHFSISTYLFSVIALTLVALNVSAVTAEDKEESQVMELAEGKLTIRVDDSWKRVKPRVRIIDHEFSIPAAEGDERPGRMTVMGAGGSIEANIARWVGQFSQPDGKSTQDRTKVEKKTIAGQEVHFVDISGTFDDKRGPFAPGVKRPKYRMLSAIILTKKNGNYFVKCYGPEKTMAKHEKAFQQMIAGMKLN